MLFRFYSNPTASGIRVAVIGEHTDGVLKIAVSRCSKKDSFIKKKGRAIAEGRLAKGKLYAQYRLAECDIKTFVEKALDVAAEVARTTIVVKEFKELVTV